jgi:DNA-binding NarL/FixJ family response regulator
MRQPILAPAAFGGSVVAGVAAMLVSGYRIVDCIQYRTGPAACDQVISDNALPLVAGVAAIAGSFGGLWTYNPALRRQEDEPELKPDPEPEPTPDPPDPPDHSELAKALRAEGFTQQAIADQLDVSRSTVQRWLKA